MTRVKVDATLEPLLLARAAGRCERCSTQVDDLEDLVPEYRCPPVGPEPPEWLQTPPNIVVLCAECRTDIRKAPRLAAAGGWLVSRPFAVRWEGVEKVAVRDLDGQQWTLDALGRKAKAVLTR